jgi:hypothetical protein
LASSSKSRALGSSTLAPVRTPGPAGPSAQMPLLRSHRAGPTSM